MTDGLKDEHRAAIIAAIAANDRVERAVLFGSRATGTNTLSSDVDIALIGDRLTLTDQARLAAALDEIPMAQEIDLVLYDSIRDHALREQIRRDGVEWYADPNDRSDRMTLATATGAGDLSDPLPSDWERSTLGEVCERSGGNIQTGPFGSQLHASDYRPEGIPSIMPQNLGDNRVIEDGIARIGELDASRLRRYLVRKGDIVYSRRGDVERRALIGPREDGWLCGTGCLRVRLGENGVDPGYASYYLGHPAVREWIVRHAHGATMPNLNTAILSACPFVVPPPSEQQSIAHVLGTLDDRIELNRSMNTTLEAMARALFKSWFVDFEPVRAKMEGRDTGLPTEVADLFPDRLVDSESGEVPMGWDTGVLADAVEILSGGTPRTSVSHYWNGDIPWYTPKDAPAPSDVFVVVTEKTITQAGVDNSSTIVLPAGTTVISARGTVGRLACLGVPMAMNQTCYGVRGADAYQSQDYFVYWLVRGTVEELRSRTHGTVFDTITRKTFAFVNLPLPPISVAKEFEFAVSPIMGRILRNLHQVGVLTALRDTLLPELISGKLQLLGQQRLIMDDGCPVAAGTHET